MKHAIIVLIHQDPNILKDLLEFFDEDFKFFIHIDKHYKCDLNSIKSAYPNCFIFSKYYVNWGGRNILLAELFLIQQALQTDDYDYFHIISGSDMPIRSLREFKSFFRQSEGLSFMEYHRYPVAKWENGTMRRIGFYWINDYLNFRNPKYQNTFEKIFNFQVKHNVRRRMPNQYEILYGGSNWMSLYKDCASEIIPNTSRKLGFLRRLCFTFAPDELYIQTVLMNSKLRENIINNNKRYIDWSGIGGSPSILREDKLRDIIFSQCLIGRKFLHPYSDRLISMIKTNIVDNNDYVEKGPDIRMGNYRFNIKEAVNISNFIELIKAQKVAELYPGPGFLLSYLSCKNVTLFGLDKNDNSFMEIRSDLFLLKSNIAFLNLSNIDISEIYFDIVIHMRSNLNEIKKTIKIIDCNFFIFKINCEGISYLEGIKEAIHNSSYRFNRAISVLLNSETDDSVDKIICLEKLYL